MKHNTRTFFIEKVIPSYKAFVDYYNLRECGLRKDTFNAGNAAESLRDLPEHIFVDIGTQTGFANANKFREEITNNNKSYKITCDIANVVKHREISRHNPSFLNLDDIKESVASVKYSDIIGEYYRARKLLEVKLLDGTVHDISDLLHASILLWSDKLFTLGFIPNIPQIPEPLPKFVKRNDSRFKGNIEIRGIAKEQFHAQLRALVYRKSKNIITETKPGEKFGKSNIPIKMIIKPSPFD